MANYATPSANPWDTFGSGRYTSWLQGVPQIGADIINANPQAAYQNWVQLAGPQSFSAQQTLQKLFSQIYNNYQGRLATNPTMAFTDYLGGQNANRLYAGVPADDRVGPTYRNFTQPARWVSGV